MNTNIQQDATIVSWFYYKITLHVSGTLRGYHQEYNTAADCHWYNMLRCIMNFLVTSTLRVVQNRTVGHITVVEF
jgi:hypothetical protein